MQKNKLGLLAFALGLSWSAPLYAETLLKVGWCAPVISPAATAFAVAQKFGWYGEGVRIQLVPLPGSTDCVKEVATGDLPYSLPSIEPLAIIQPQGVRAKNFYLAYHQNIYGIAVPADSPIKDYVDLKGKLIGVTTMGSGGVIVARALVANAGLNPNTDVRIVAVGEAGQAAAMVRNKQVDALSQFDAAYGLIENAGIKLRFLDKSAIIHFPSNGLIALDKTLVERRAEAVALGRATAMGTLFTMTNPEAAVRILFEVFPQTKPTGVDDAGALKLGLAPLYALMHVFDPHGSTGVTKWGESSFADYDAYIDFLMKWGVVKQKVPASEIVTNDLIDDINKFDAAAVVEKAKTWKQ
jgi:NitT/TauT family transport system substrate-binding protein